jgi:hypothetical protein
MSKISENIMRAELISQCKEEILTNFPLITNLTNKRELGYWTFDDTDLIGDLIGVILCGRDAYIERSFIYMLLILESEGK